MKDDAISAMAFMGRLNKETKFSLYLHPVMADRLLQVRVRKTGHTEWPPKRKTV